MRPFPTIHLAIEHMQYHIAQAIYPYEQELEEAIQQAVAQAVATFSPEQEIEHMVRITLRQQIQQRVNTAVLVALQQQSDPPLIHRIREEVARQLKEEQR